MRRVLEWLNRPRGQSQFRLVQQGDPEWFQAILWAVWLWTALIVVVGVAWFVVTVVQKVAGG